MDAARLAAWTRRRIGLAAGGMAAFLPTLAGLDTAGAKRKRKKKLKINEFGCVNVGGKCRGKDAVCCSGICQGKKPNRGKKDKSRCVGHDGSTCLVGQDACAAAFVACPGVSKFARCFTTTGNAAYCGGDVFCRACARDADCPPAEFEPGAACIVCTTCPDDTACATLKTFF